MFLLILVVRCQLASTGHTPQNLENCGYFHPILPTTNLSLCFVGTRKSRAVVVSIRYLY